MRSISILPLKAALAIAVAFGLAACGGERQDAYDDAATPPADTATPVSPAIPGAPADQPAGMDGAMDGAGAMAVLSATEGNSVTGELTFAAIEGGVAIRGQVNGLSPGSEHGFHVHETGDCSAPDATSAGGHFNPNATAHGRVGEGDHHVGDTDNLMADDTGVADVDTRLEGATLGDGGPADIMGRAVIVHADADDYTTQPTGNAGARLACGVISQAL